MKTTIALVLAMLCVACGDVASEPCEANELVDADGYCVGVAGIEHVLVKRPGIASIEHVDMHSQPSARSIASK